MRKEIEDNLDTIVFAKISCGIKENELLGTSELLDNSKLTEYIDFLKESRDSAFGEVVLFSYSELQEYQYYIDELPDKYSDLICIGKILSDPIMISKKDGKVYWISGYPYLLNKKCLGNFNRFMMIYVFGRRYSQIIPWADEDEWYKFLRELRIV